MPGSTDPICHDFILRSAMLFQAPRQLFKKTIQSVLWAIFASFAFFLSKKGEREAQSCRFPDRKQYFHSDARVGQPDPPNLWSHPSPPSTHYLPPPQRDLAAHQRVCLNYQLFGTQCPHRSLSEQCVCLPVATGSAHPQGAKRKWD